MTRRPVFILLFIALMAYLAFRFLAERREGLFQDYLIGIDTASVTAVSILPAASPLGEFYLKREGKTWIASQGNRSVKALPGAVAELLKKLVRLESVRVVATGEKSWEEFGVGPDQGIRVGIFQNGYQLEDFVVGEERLLEDSLLCTFVRIWSDDEVFAVSGPLQGLWPGFDAFRSMSLLTLDPVKVRSLQWETAGTDTVILFSDSLRAFLSSVQSLSASALADGFDPVSMAGSLQGRLIFSGSEWESPVEVRYYTDSLWQEPFIFYSTQNPDNYFFSDSSDLYFRLVQPLYSLFPGVSSDSLSQ